MRAVHGWALRLRLLVLAVTAGTLAVGVVLLRGAPVDVLPEFTPTYAEAQTEALGLSAEEVEQLITVPLEADLLNGVEGVDVIRRSRYPACRASSWSSPTGRTCTGPGSSCRSG